MQGFHPVMEEPLSQYTKHSLALVILVNSKYILNSMYWLSHILYFDYVL